MAITVGGLITDPDSLDYEISSTGTKELFIDTATKKIRLVRVGNLTADGVTIKCLYSKLKEVWKSDTTLIKYSFPMTPITDEQFEFSNGWDLEKTVVASTSIVHAGTNSGTNATFVVTTSGNFNTSNVVPGMYISGTGIGAGARVVSVNSNTSITVSVANSGTVSGSLTFWTDNDYTFNLIRSGGWALKDAAGVTQEEWIGVISLGQLGAELTNKTLALTATSTASSTISVASTSGLQVGSFVVGKSIPSGTTIVSVTDSTDFVISKTITLASGALVTIRPKDQIYYQIGNATSNPINFALTGAVNQAVKTYGDASHGNFDVRDGSNVFRLKVREQGYTYGKQSKEDIGVSVLTYKLYSFPLSNSSDAIKITHSDLQIDSDSDNVADLDVYQNMSITWYASPQTRSIGGVNRDFNIIIDADTGLASGTPGPATAEQIYEFVQWSLRRGVGVDIDASGSSSAVGSITRDLLQFVGDTLYTLYDPADGDGIYIDNFSATDTNRITFADNTGTNRTFPYTAAGILSFNSNLVADGVDAIYRVFFTKLYNAAFGTANAVLVKKADNSTDISGTISGSSIAFDFDYDGNTQATWTAARAYATLDEYRNGTTWYRVDTGYTSGGTFGATDLANSTVIAGPSVKLVAIGLTNSQYVLSDGIIARSISNTLSAVASLERNYANVI